MEFINDLNDFKIYSAANHTLYEDTYRYKYALPFERVDDPKGLTVNIFQRYWYHSITISILYFATIKAIQRMMENRKPFTLRTALILWNGALAIFSILGFLRFSEDFFQSLYKHGFYQSVCYSCHPSDVAAFWSLLFAISKIVELGDTLFIVLRKKPLIFLHYYHHAAVLIYTVHSGAEHAAPGRAFITMNYFAHSAMYTYYTLSAYGIRMPKWVSMCVTTIQTAQMMAGVAVSYIVYNYKTQTLLPCQQSMVNLYLAFIIYITFGILFLHFFYRAYLAKPKKQKAEKSKTQ
ncbi:unnamed protein product [Nippostrongylus brasiliensis]|uniref:Elongation of very long chain fatty acids protein n=1 Tax=Nippostrongylus brasiliensis TaxID=27835 RepID=A0A0N4YXW4_NIPBR|nr:unnamed protein product [Nippostrongylus brasiliensis]